MVYKQFNFRLNGFDEPTLDGLNRDGLAELIFLYYRNFSLNKGRSFHPTGKGQRITDLFIRFEQITPDLCVLALSRVLGPAENKLAGPAISGMVYYF